MTLRKSIDPADRFFTDINRTTALVREHFNNDSSIQLNYWQVNRSNVNWSPVCVELYISHVNTYVLTGDDFESSTTTDLATVRLDVNEYGLFFKEDKKAIIDLINRAKLELFR